MSESHHIPPANPFWNGYTRSPETTAALIAALSKALYAEPTHRLGQLLTNLARGRDIWDVYDEDWIDSLSSLATRAAEDRP